MRRCIFRRMLPPAVLLGLVFAPAKADDWPTLPDWATLPHWMIRHKADQVGPNSLFQMARSLDEVEEKIHDDGVVTIKQPDVWSQQSMTKYRKDFEQQMSSALENFSFIFPRQVYADRPGLVFQPDRPGRLVDAAWPRAAAAVGAAEEVAVCWADAAVVGPRRPSPARRP